MDTLALPSSIPSNTPTLVPTNTSIDPTMALKNTVNDIIEAIPYLTASMSYEPETVLLRLAELWKELKLAASAYQAVVPHPG